VVLFLVLGFDARVRVFRLRRVHPPHRFLVLTYGLAASAEHDDGFVVVDVLDVAARGRARFNVVVVNGSGRVALHVSLALARAVASGVAGVSAVAGGVLLGCVHFGRRRRRGCGCGGSGFGRGNAHVAHALADDLPDSFQECVSEFGSAAMR